MNGPPSRLFFGDEAEFSLSLNPPYGWQFPGEPIRILPQMGKRINILGLMKASGDELHTFCGQGSVKTDFVIESINTWRRGLTRPTVLVLDNARIHRSAALLSQLSQWQDEGLFIFFLPTYSPHLNRTERLWLKVKQRWLKPADYAILASLGDVLDRIWKQFGQVYQVTFN